MVFVEEAYRVSHTLPLVTIAVLSMNHEQYIKQSLLSFVNQTYANIEIVFLDNCSKDATYELATKLLASAGISCRTYQREKSYSVTQNVNFLVQQARGKYITIISADDWFTLDCIEIMLRHYEANPQFGFVYGNGWYFYEETDEYKLAATKNFKEGKIFDTILLEGVLFPPGIMVNKETYDKVGLYDESLSVEDLDFWLKVSYEMEVGYVSKPVIFYRKHKKSMTGSGVSFHKVEEYLYVVGKYKSHPRYKKAHRLYRKQYILGYCLNENYRAALPYMLKDFRFERFYISVLLRHFIWRRILKIFGLSRAAKH